MTENEVVGSGSPSLGASFGWGLLVAIGTGMFSTLLLAIFIGVGDPTELTNGSITELSATLVRFVFGGWIFAVPVAILVGWVPISLMGWFVARMARRSVLWLQWRRWLVVGCISGGGLLALINICIDLTDGSSSGINWTDTGYFGLFGAGCGMFAAMLFRRLIFGGKPA